MASPVDMAHLLEGITGPFVVGTAVSTFLLGVTLTQTYTYFMTFVRDRSIYRCAVVFLALVDAMHSACCWVTLWKWFVKDYGNPVSVANAPWSFAVDPMMCGMAACVVQLFYAHRIYVLNKKKLHVPLLVAFGSFFQLGWSLACTVQVFVIKYFANFQQFTYGVALWLGTAAATDLVITATLVWLLLKSKSGGLESTNTIIDKIVRLTIETNGLTFACAVLDVVLFATRSDASHVAPNLCLVKLYFNSFLVSLNSRNDISRNMPQHTLTDVKRHLSNGHVTTQNTVGAPGTTKNGLLTSPGIAVYTTSSVHSERDLGKDQDEIFALEKREIKSPRVAHIYADRRMSKESEEMSSSQEK